MNFDWSNNEIGWNMTNEIKCHKHAFIWAITVNVKDMYVYTSLAIYPHVANA